MKPLFLAAILALPLAVIGTVNAAPPTTEQLQQACSGYAGFGEMVATQRQNNVPLAELIKSFDQVENSTPEEKKVMEQIANIAYTADIETTDEGKKEAVIMFASAIYESCEEELSKENM